MEEIDPLNINSDIQEKKPYDVSQLSSDVVEKYLSILARVFRNSDEVKDLDLTEEVFDYLLEAYCSFGFFLIEEIEINGREIAQNEGADSDEIKILKTLTNIIPIFTQVSFYDGIGHYNIEGIIKNKIEQLKQQSNSNQYKLFLLYFLLIDIDIQKNKKYLDEILSFISMGILKTSIVFKLNYYLSFKAFNNPSLEKLLRTKIQTAQLNLNNRTDIGTIHKDLEDRHKSNLIKKQSDK